MTGHQHTDDAGGSKRRLTYADFRRFPNDGRRHELINGEHAVTASPNIRHQQLSVRMTVALATYLEAAPVGTVFHAPLDCVFSFFDVVEPDLLVVTKEQQEIITKRNVRGAPALVIEILSESSEARDKRTKRALYEQVGVKEYWVVDPDTDCVSVYRRGATGQFRFPETLAASNADALTTQLLPGFALDLVKFFRSTWLSGSD